MSQMSQNKCLLRCQIVAFSFREIIGSICFQFLLKTFVIPTCAWIGTILELPHP